MKSLNNDRDLGRILDRLDRLRADTPRAWGKMSSAQMVRHLLDSFSLATGEMTCRGRGGLLNRTLVKWIALYLPVPWPRGFPAPRELDQEYGGTPPDDSGKICGRCATPPRRLSGQA